MPDLSEFTRKWRPVRHIWPIVAAACLGLVVAVAAWFAASVWEERLARAKFTAIAGDYASVLQNGLDEYLGKIVAVRAFYDSSHAVDPNDSLKYLTQYPVNRFAQSHGIAARGADRAQSGSVAPAHFVGGLSVRTQKSEIRNRNCAAHRGGGGRAWLDAVRSGAPCR